MVDYKTQIAILTGIIFGILFSVVISVILGVTTGHLNNGIGSGASIIIAGVVGFSIMNIRKIKRLLLPRVFSKTTKY